jgi:transcription antitermination factor NusA-like protein
LQHTDDPTKIINNALKAAKVLRIFEWVDILPHEGHPQMITKDFLDKCIGQEGNTAQLAENGCFGKAYYNIKN